MYTTITGSIPLFNTVATRGAIAPVPYHDFLQSVSEMISENCLC